MRNNVTYFAYKMTKRYRGTVIEREDFEQEGQMALLKSKEKFDPEREATLETFAQRRVKGAMLDLLRRWDHIKRHQRAKSKLSGETLPTVSVLREDDEVPGDEDIIVNDFDIMLRGLKRDEKLAVKLHFIENMNHAEVAKVIGCSPCGAFFIFKQAMRFLKERYAPSTDRQPQ
jgi:RNA polymerase sigma factor (sigma-70 family)